MALAVKSLGLDLCFVTLQYTIQRSGSGERERERERERDLPGMEASAEETRGVMGTNLSEPSAAPGVTRWAG